MRSAVGATRVGSPERAIYHPGSHEGATKPGQLGIGDSVFDPELRIDLVQVRHAFVTNGRHTPTRMKFAVRPLSPTDAVLLPRQLPAIGTTRADVGLWLAEVQANRCLVDRTCFQLLRNESPAGYLLGFSRHGHATCTGLEVDAGAPHAAAWQLVHAFMERLVELEVDSADFCLSARVEAAQRLLKELGATEVGTRSDLRFGTGTRTVLQLDLRQSKFQKLFFAGRCGASANVPAAPTPVDPGVGPRGGNPFLTPL
jgi:hypothetical protein